MPTRTLTAPAEPRAVRTVFGCFPSGVVAVCAEVAGTKVGMAMSAFTGVSLDPPLVSICPDRLSTTWPLLRQAARLGVSVLADEHGPACRQLSARSGDRFAGLGLQRTVDGAVLLEGATAWLDCSLYAELPGGDHTVALLRVEELSADPGAAPLVFHDSRFRQLVL